MKKVLIITRDFPPYCRNVGWMIRSASMANFFVRSNYEVHVIANKRNVVYHDLLEVEKAIKMHPVKNLNYWETEKISSYPVRLFNHIIFKLCSKSLADKTHIFLFIFIKKAIRIIKENEIKNIIISVPPGSLVLVAYYLREKFGKSLNIVLDYRDAWTLRKMYIKGRSESSLNYLRSLEQKSLKSCDHVVFVSKGMQRIYNSVFQIPFSSIVENGFIALNNKKGDKDNSGHHSFLEARNNCRKGGKIVIGYFGSGSIDGTGHKDATNLIKVLTDNKYLAEKVCLVFQGNITRPKVFLPDYLSIHFIKSANYNVVMYNMQYVDLAMITHSESYDAPMVMGAKLYDYIASSKPIWLLIPQNAESLLEFAKQTQKPFISNIFDLKSIEDSLLQIVEIWEKGDLETYGFSKDEALAYSRESQYMKMLNIFKG